MSIHRYTVYGDVGAIKELLRSGIDINSRNTNQETALYVAVLNKKHIVLAFLIDQGADLNAASSSGMSPSILALRLNDIVSFRMLLEAGADVDLGMPHDEYLHERVKLDAPPQFGVVIHNEKTKRTTFFEKSRSLLRF